MNKVLYGFLLIIIFSFNCSQEDLFNNLSDSPDIDTSDIDVKYKDSSSVTLSWAKASDDYTDQSELMYMVVKSESDNIDTVRECEHNGTPVCDWTADISTADVTGLEPDTEYYFNVLVKDEGDNKTVYKSALVKITYPVPGNSGLITAESAGDIINLTWTEATDSTTQQSELVYKVFQSSSDNIGTVEDAEANGTALNDWTAAISTFSFPRMYDGIYYFNVLVMDTDFNESAYTMVSLELDMEPPVPGTNGAITVSMTNQSAVLTWSAAADTVTSQNKLQYKVYLSAQDNIDTVENAENNGTVIIDWMPALTSATVNGLKGYPRYYFNVIVRDLSQNKAAYSMKCAVFAYCVSNSGSDTSGDGTAVNPFLTIQHGINCSDNDNVSSVWVEIGTYDESNIDLDPDGNSSAVSVYGGFADGFAGGFGGRSMDATSRSKIRASSGAVINVDASVGQGTFIDGFIICGICLSPSINGIDNYGSPVIQNNIIYAGGSSSSLDTVYGIYNSGDSNPVIRNNIIYGGSGSGRSVAIYANLSNKAVIYNNTINGGDGSSYSYAVYCEKSSTPCINNNIIFTGNAVYGYGIYEFDAESDPVEVKNNCFFDCPSGAYYDFDSSSSISSAQIVSAADTDTVFSGNIFVDLIEYGYFVDYTDYDGGGLRLDEDAPDSVAYGGLYGYNMGWGFNTDITWNDRSGNGTTGWSMGAYERE